MVVILILFVGGLLLWLLFRDSGEKQQQAQVARDQEYQRLKSDYDKAKREAREAFRKMAEEKYTKMGLGHLLHKLVVMDSEENGEIQVKFVDLSDEQRELVLKKIHEDEESELVDVQAPDQVNHFNINIGDNTEVHVSGTLNVNGDVLTDNSVKIISKNN